MIAWWGVLLNLMIGGAAVVALLPPLRAKAWGLFLQSPPQQINLKLTVPALVLGLSGSVARGRSIAEEYTAQADADLQAQQVEEEIHFNITKTRTAFDAGNPAEAVARFKAAAKLGRLPDVDATLYEQAIGKQAISQARDLMKQGVKYSEQGDWSKSLALLKQAQSIRPTLTGLDEALRLAEQGFSRVQEKEVLRSIAKLKPSLEVIRERISSGELEEAEKNLADARATLKTVGEKYSPIPPIAINEAGDLKASFDQLSASLREERTRRVIIHAKKVAGDKSLCLDETLKPVSDAWERLKGIRKGNSQYSQAKKAAARLEKCRRRMIRYVQQSAEQSLIVLRKNEEKGLDKYFLQHNLDVKVRVTGKKKDRITLRHVFFENRVWHHRLEQAGFFDRLARIGFKKVYFRNGYGKGFNFKLGPSPDPYFKIPDDHMIAMGFGEPFKI